MSLSRPIAGLDLGNAWARLAVCPPTEEKPPLVFSLPSLLVFAGEEILSGADAQTAARARPRQAVERLCARLAQPGSDHSHGERTFTTVELAALLFHRLGQLAGTRLGCPLEDVILVVPAGSSAEHRRALADSARGGGLNVRAELPAPLAVALAYGLHKQEEQQALVFNLGVSFETALVQVRKQKLRVLARSSDPNLGGPACDQTMLSYLAQIYREQTGHEDDPFADELTRRDVMAEIEVARIQLSQRDLALVVLRGRARVDLELTRQTFEEQTAERLEDALRLTNGMLLDAESAHGDHHFDRILLAGGTAVMPAVARRLQREYGMVVECETPETAAARGAALFGALVSKPSRRPKPAQADPSRVRVLRWTLERRLFGGVEVVIRGDLSGADWLGLVGQVNEIPATPADGRCLTKWPPATNPDGPELRLGLERWPEKKGEVFCSLFVTPEQDFVIESPPWSERVAWSN